MNRIELGKKGEQLATEFLVRNGYEILSKNYRCSFGEIDIIASIRETLIFVEVRTKSTIRFGCPVESMTQQKAKKVRRVAEHYLSKTRVLTGRGIRFDFIGVFIERGAEPKIEHIQGAY